jgi:hypothetical protein
MMYKADYAKCDFQKNRYIKCIFDLRYFQLTMSLLEYNSIVRQGEFVITFAFYLFLSGLIRQRVTERFEKATVFHCYSEEHFMEF